MTAKDPRPVGERWKTPADARRYETERWRSEWAAERDPRRVRRILARWCAEGRCGRVLDVACGGGRLRDALGSSAYVGVDVSAAMLARSSAGRRVRASALALPFRNDCFDAVVCVRLLHHLADDGALRRALGELVRVSRRLVVVSFWDRASLPALRRRLRLRPARRHADGRVAISREELGARVAAAGATVVGFDPGPRFLSMQAFLIAEKRDAR